MGRLGDTLDSLKRDDGTPDTGARKSELSELVDHLTAAEITELRIRLNAITLSNDPCSKFPLEIVQQIAQYLDLGELIRAVRVSKSWLGALRNPAFSKIALKWHFSMTFEQYFNVKKGEEVTGKSPVELLLSMAKRHIRRQRGQFKSSKRYEIPDLSTYQYSNGSIAFLKRSVPLPDTTIEVYNLRTGTTTLYAEGNRQPFHWWHLSDSLLICELRRPLRLLVWRLESPTMPLIIHLPGPWACISAYQDQIGIITTGPEIMIWKWGGPLTSININTLRLMFDARLRLKSGEVFFHPLNPDHLFVTFQASGAPDTPEDTGKFGSDTIVVAEYAMDKIKQWKLNSTYPWKPSYGFEIERDFEVQLHDGNFGIHAMPYSGLYALGTFDIFRKTFRYDEFQLPKTTPKVQIVEPSIEKMFPWRNQVLVPAHMKDFTTGYCPVPNGFPGVTGVLLAFDSSPPAPTSEVRLLGQIIDTTALRQPEIPSPSYCWLGKECDIDRTSVCRGDDNFVVLSSSQGFVVWCFEED